MAKPTKHGDKWRIRWLDEHGSRQSAVFDDYQRAQTELCRKQVELEEVKRGIRNAAPPEKRFGDLCDYWLDKRAPRKRSRKDDASIIRKHLRPAFGEMKLRGLGVEDVDAYVNTKIDDEELSDKTVGNHVTLLATMLRLATTFKVPWVVSVPRFRQPKVALFSRDYQWRRGDDEVRRFLAAARGEDEHVLVFYGAAVYTGMRAGELAALEWPDVDLDRRLITVQRSFDGPTKSDRVPDAVRAPRQDDSSPRAAVVSVPVFAFRSEHRRRHKHPAEPNDHRGLIQAQLRASYFFIFMPIALAHFRQ